MSLIIAFIIGYAAHGFITAGERKRQVIECAKAVAIVRSDGYRAGSEVPPLEFIGSDEIAVELCRRNDIAVVFWGRVQSPQTPLRFFHKCPAEMRYGVVHDIARCVIPELSEGSEQ